MGRRRVYINPFNVAGSAYSGWVEVTKDVFETGLGTVEDNLDVSEYDIGVFTNSAVGLTLQNANGLYSEVGSGSSIFYVKRSDSLVKITYDPAEQDYLPLFSNINDIVSGGETIVFQGLLNDDSTVMQLVDQSISFNVLGYESILDRVLIDSTWAGALPADYKASTMLKRILAIAAASTTVSVLTVNNALIVPGNDITWDSIATFTNKTAREAVNLILTAANSVMYMSGTTPIVSGRTAGATVAYAFAGPGSATTNENIEDIRDISSGLNRTFNVVTWITGENPPLTNLSSIDASSKATYGARKKNVTVDGITTVATQQAVIDAIRTEFASPKQELTLLADLNLNTLAVGLLSRVTIDYPLVSVDPILAQYGIAQYGTDQYPTVLSTFTIDTTTPYKVIGLSVDLQALQISFRLRRI